MTSKPFREARTRTRIGSYVEMCPMRQSPASKFTVLPIFSLLLAARARRCWFFNDHRFSVRISAD